MSPLDRERAKIAPARITTIQYLCLAVFLYLVSGFWQLQVQSPDLYAEQAERNRIRSLPVIAPRGKILDRDGRVLADNHSAFSVVLSRTNLNEANLKIIAEGLNLPYEEVQRRLHRARSLPEYHALVLKQGLSQADVAFIEAHRHEFPELELIGVQHRLYPADGFASHLIGYVGEVSETELNTPDFALYEPGAIVGKTGIERQYNDVLTGVDGRREVIVDSHGVERGVIGIREPKPGRSIRLTIDLDLQAAAELAMEGRKGAVVALDPRNGEVLALVSTPNFDPNQFAGRIKAAQWRELTNNPDKPLLNRAIQAQLAPGSTFKPFVALAALESGEIDENFSVRCGGGATFFGRYFRCHLKTGHGVVSLHKGIAQSCDVYFYNVGNKTGVDKIAEYAEMAGLGRRTGIDLPNEEAGVMPSSKWKIRELRAKWYAGETISVAIGQGYTTVTPLQLTVALGGVLMGGVWHRPHLVPEEEMRAIRPGYAPPAPRRAELNPEHVEQVKYGLWAVVNEGGTGLRARIPGYDIIGKTGTAQVASVQLTKTRKEREFLDNAWFIGAVPRDNPELVVTALLEHGEHGNLAAPIVRDVLKAYLDKQVRRQLTQGPPSAPAQPSQIGALRTVPASRP
jgi:penicillin-binding protein 2